jgi:hypothetical protein
MNFWNILQITFGLILTLKKPVEVLLLLPFFLKRYRNLTQLLDFAYEAKELRAFHVGQGIIEVGREPFDQGNDEGIEISQLLLGISEKII